MTRLGNMPAWSWDNWMADENRSGLTPFDLHIHDLDFMVYAFGAPKQAVRSRCRQADQDHLIAMYDFDGFTIHSEAAWYAPQSYKFNAGFRFQFEKAVVVSGADGLVVYEKDGGVIRQIFESDLPRMYEEGCVLSALYPFSHVFYRKFGYDLCIIRRNAKFSPNSLRKGLHRAASIRRILPDEPDGGMKQVYETYMADKNLGILRLEEQWKSLRSGTP